MALMRRCGRASYKPKRKRMVAASRKFPSSSPERSLPPLIQFGHSSMPETRKLPFDPEMAYFLVDGLLCRWTSYRVYGCE